MISLRERGYAIDAAAASRLIAQFRQARRSRTETVLEGLHPLKHALRFGAVVEPVVTGDLPLLTRLCKALAPDVERTILERAITVAPSIFSQLAPVPPETGVIAIAPRRPVPVAKMLSAHRSTPLVLLEQPSHLGNIGAVVRVAASAGASGVITTGRQDPWHPTAVRGAAGLQYALPIGSTPDLPDEEMAGPFIAIHPEGDLLTPGSIPTDAILAFGSERRGLSQQLLERVDHCLAIPMQPQVSSLNLATAVAVTLYAWRLCQTEFEK